MLLQLMSKEQDRNMSLKCKLIQLRAAATNRIKFYVIQWETLVNKN